MNNNPAQRFLDLRMTRGQGGGFIFATSQLL